MIAIAKRSVSTDLSNLRDVKTVCASRSPHHRLPRRTTTSLSVPPPLTSPLRKPRQITRAYSMVPIFRTDIIPGPFQYFFQHYFNALLFY